MIWYQKNNQPAVQNVYRVL